MTTRMDKARALFDSARRPLLAAAVLAVVALAFATIAPTSTGKGFASSELHFTDRSVKGLAIVPASCPSYPHYSGECGGTPPPSGACMIIASPQSIAADQSSTLTWTVSDYSSLGSIAPSNITLTGFGAVGRSGSTLVSNTGTYALSGVYLYPYFGFQVGSFYCDTTISSGGGCQPGWVTYGGTCVSSCPAGTVDRGGTCIATSCPVGYTLVGSSCVFTGCPAGYVQQGGSCVLRQCGATYLCTADNLYYQDSSCNQNFVQHCSWGCTGGACLPPPPPDGTISIAPALLRKGQRSQVHWEAHNVTSCTVSAGNGDSWSGSSGTQTTKVLQSQMIYKLTCTGLDGTTLVQQATVNIVPTFCEQGVQGCGQ